MNTMEVLSDYQHPLKTHNFYPYSDNGGTTVAIAGDDFALLASDTRLPVGFNILSRDTSKCVRLTNKTVLGTTGCWADVQTVWKILQARLTMYEHEHSEQMGTGAIAQMLATMLYYRRFFPYYVSNLLVGLDNEGKGAVYTYDPVGHMELVKFRAGGASTSQIQPLLDNQLAERDTPMTLTEARKMIHDTFISASERDINTGDGVIIYAITKDGITEETIPLRKD